MKNIVIGSDHGGFKLKEKVREYLEKSGYRVRDVGAFCEEPCDYPEFAAKAASAVSKGLYERGILICKSGIGNSIVANKFPGVRAALCYNLAAARLSREHNDSNILVLGSRFVTSALAKKMALAWLNTKFQGGRHQRRLNIIKSIERKIRGGRC